MKTRMSALVAVLSLAAGMAACSEETASRGYEEQAPLYSNSDYTYSEVTAPAYRSAQPTYSNPGYTVPQPVYPSPQPSYANPQPTYVPPSGAVAVLPARSLPEAVGHLRATTTNVLIVTRDFGPNNYTVLRNYLRNVDDQVARLEYAVNDRDRLRDVRDAFRNVRRAVDDTQRHLDTHDADQRIRDAWFQVQGAVQEVSNAIDYRY